MARGQQKIQSQMKAQEKAAKNKKGHSAMEQLKAAQKALIHTCSICKAQMPDPKTYKQHFENKHPKLEMPEELKSL